MAQTLPSNCPVPRVPGRAQHCTASRCPPQAPTSRADGDREAGRSRRPRAPGVSQADSPGEDLRQDAPCRHSPGGLWGDARRGRASVFRKHTQGRGGIGEWLSRARSPGEARSTGDAESPVTVDARCPPPPDGGCSLPPSPGPRRRVGGKGVRDAEGDPERERPWLRSGWSCPQPQGVPGPGQGAGSPLGEQGPGRRLPVNRTNEPVLSPGSSRNQAAAPWPRNGKTVQRDLSDPQGEAGQASGNHRRSPSPTGRLSC